MRVDLGATRIVAFRPLLLRIPTTSGPHVRTPITAGDDILGRTESRIGRQGRAMVTTRESTAGQTAGAAGVVLMTLASAQFLMTLDSSVMNVSIAQVAEDVGTTVTGIQTAITLYTLVMATLMITGGKIGEHDRAASARSPSAASSTAPARSPPRWRPNLTVLIVGWSFLEGMGAALIMPAIVALVASNFARDRAAARLRPGGLRRCDRGRGRAADRRCGARRT